MKKIISAFIHHTDCSINSAVLTPVPMLLWGSTLSGSRQRPGALPLSTVPENTHTRQEYLGSLLGIICEMRRRWDESWGDRRRDYQRCPFIALYSRTGEEVGQILCACVGVSVCVCITLSMHHSDTEWRGPHIVQTALRNDRNPLSDPVS